MQEVEIVFQSGWNYLTEIEKADYWEFCNRKGSDYCGRSKKVSGKGSRSLIRHMRTRNRDT